MCCFEIFLRQLEGMTSESPVGIQPEGMTEINPKQVREHTKGDEDIYLFIHPRNLQ